ncbi:hypothetical protein EYC80_004784 [Monilinia laxa]|uniref:Uncharacterized protein n=1 Tax=Monilinia laxa TaxID=61186 RepID=A0A5N6KI23_MONLA|nr:hypothetical protein EYC80_004784 [Monilinia laxa]
MYSNLFVLWVNRLKPILLLLPIKQRTAQVGDLCKNITLLLGIPCKDHEIASSKKIHGNKEKIVQMI